MKSKKIIALIVAFAAFMAVATSGLAATTTYNYKTDGYVDVNVEVKAQAGKEVTYLVKNGSEILYIDQKTADATSGIVSFDYKIKDDKMPTGYTGVVAAFGTDGTSVVTSDGDETLAFGATSATGANYSIVYKKGDTVIGDTAILGTDDEIDAVITPDANYTITGVTVGGVPVAEGDIVAAGMTVRVTKGQAIAVTTAVKETEADIENYTPGVSDEFVGSDSDPSSVDETDTVTVDGKDYDLAAKTTFIKVVGTPHEIGVKYGDNYYKAMDDGNGYKDGQYYAVRIIINGTEIPVVTPYVQKTENGEIVTK